MRATMNARGRGPRDSLLSCRNPWIHSASSTASPTCRMPIRILIVDDQAPMRGALAAFLNTRPNMQVVAQLEDGVAAIRIATELHPDIVVMDLLLPSLDGIEATRQIMLACPDTDVVLLSARMDG